MARSSREGRGREIRPEHPGCRRRSARSLADRAEEAEDRASAQAALDEYRRDGGEAAESFFGSLAAETKATYGPTDG
jgi:hypothetical protein